MSRRALVAGATGFVGRHVVARLLAEDWSVVALARPQRPVPVSWAGRVEVVRLSGVGDDDLAAALGSMRCDVVVNLAAYGVNPGDRDPLAAKRVNVDLAAALVRLAAARGAAVVHAGSSAEYAASDASRLTEDAPLAGVRIYGASKAAGGLFALATASALGAPMRLLRLFNVYGPGEAPHRLLPTLVAARGGASRIALSPGVQIRDFLHVEDAAAGLCRAADRLAAGELTGALAANLCTGAATSVRDFVEFAARRLDLAPARLGFGDIPMRPDDLMRVVGDPRAMIADLGWRPTLDLEQGLARAIRADTEGDEP